MVIRKRKGMMHARPKKQTSSPSKAPKSTKISKRKPNDSRRNRAHTVYDEKWENFIDKLETELNEASNFPPEIARSPYYAHANIVKRSVYRFFSYVKENMKPGLLQTKIDAIRIEKYRNKVLRTLRKDIKSEPYYWILMGLYIDCPAARLRKSDVTRFAQHLNYARRHEVPPEYLIGFLLQTGSLAEVYRRATQDTSYREKWYIDKINA